MTHTSGNIFCDHIFIGWSIPWGVHQLYSCCKSAIICNLCKWQKCSSVSIIQRHDEATNFLKIFKIQKSDKHLNSYKQHLPAISLLGVELSLFLQNCLNLFCMSTFQIITRLDNQDRNKLYKIEIATPH